MIDDCTVAEGGPEGGRVGATPAGRRVARPEIDAAEAELADRFRLALTRLHRRLRQQSTGGLTPSQAAALASTERLGSPTLGELATLESVQPPSMTRIVTALEEKGLVSKVVDPTDRRVSRVTASELGRKVLEENRSLKTAFLAERLHRLGPDDRRALGEMTGLLERLGEVSEP
ncbi:MAG: MarR family winged helix-turn-helix transcriptional regulator [Acidimicrobiales bacterium]|jgi:DNA-binding MarR family transcriptional regulator